MYFKKILIKHFSQIKKGGIKISLKKLLSLLFIFFQLPIYLISVPIFIIIVLIRPWYLIRWNSLYSSRIGHFAGNTELYCCERDANINFPKQKYKDFFYLSKYTCNKVLENMWRRNITILPSWLLKPIHTISNFFHYLFGLKNIHEINNPINEDRDLYNLHEKFKPHLSFTEDEEIKGKKILEKFGLSGNAKFVCLIVRDSGYLNRHAQKEKSEDRWDFQSFRDGDIDRYVLAAEELASRGYYVFRMGVNVKKPLKSLNPKIIDYANSEIRSDFMDIYLGAKCSFCISTACGFDAIPMLFRRPIAFVFMPIGECYTNNEKILLLTKHHINISTKKELTLSEILTSNLGYAESSQEFLKNNVELQENTPEEIRDLVIEMDERINQKWKETDQDILLQQDFWSTFKKSTDNLDVPKNHRTKEKFGGKIKAKFSANYLSSNKNWIN